MLGPPMDYALPKWLADLQPAEPPKVEVVDSTSSLQLWHVDVALVPVSFVLGRELSRSETWNGKPLVLVRSCGETEGVEGVAEAEITQRLRNAGWKAYWSRGQKRWGEWTLASSPSDREAFHTIDASIRQHSKVLRANRAGRPDIVAWDPQSGSMHCMEYKGPSCRDPYRADTIKPEQVAWFKTALELGILSFDNCAVVRWRPTRAAAALLRAQSATHEPFRRVHARTSTGGLARTGNVGHLPQSRVVPRAKPLLPEPLPIPPSIEAFLRDDPGSHGRFCRWRGEHRDHFVVNLRHPRDAMFHVADCHTLGEEFSPELPQANTKLGSPSLPELMAFVEAKDWRSRECGFCARRLRKG